MNAVVLTGTQDTNPSEYDGAGYDPRDVLDTLAGRKHTPLSIAPITVTDRLVRLLNSPDETYAIFEAAACGESLVHYAKRNGLSYFALTALYESQCHPFPEMRRIAALAVARDDRERARTAVRDAANCFLEEGNSRYVQRLVDLSKLEHPDHQPAAAKAAATTVNVGISFGAALAQHHRDAKARAAVTIEQRPAPEPARSLEDFE